MENYEEKIQALELWWEQCILQNQLTEYLSNIKAKLNEHPKAGFASIEILGNKWPNGLQTLRIFALRPGIEYPKERHLNSTQWIKTISGEGQIEVWESGKEMELHRLKEGQTGVPAWSTVASKIWHRPVNTGTRTWVTAAFHSADKVEDEFEE